MIKLYAVGNKLSLASNDFVTSNNINSLFIEVTLDAQYSNLINFVIFRCGTVVKPQSSDNNIYTIPQEVLIKENIGKNLEIGVTGIEGATKILATNYISIGKLVEGCNIEDSNSAPPTPTEIQIITGLATEARDNSNLALDLANDTHNQAALAKEAAAASAQYAEEQAGIAAGHAATAEQQAGIAGGHAADALTQATRAEDEADRAKDEADNAGESAAQSAQSLSDLLAMMGIDIATLTGGKLTPSQIPAIAITDTFVTSSESEMLALAAQTGDVCIRTDESKTYILQGDDPGELTDWQQLRAPTNYADQAGHASTADEAVNAQKINNHRLVTMTEEQYAGAVLDEGTLYAVHPAEES